ncbi:MAG: hypothetical protein C0598_13430, partial [Marinilabiliales bacterium]
MSRVFVSGIGIISSIGKNLVETYDSLVEKRSGISKISILETKHKDEFLVGEIKLTHEQLIELAEVNPELAWTRTALLGIIAAKQAVKDAGIKTSECSLISASTVGGMDRSELYYKDFLTEARHSKFIDSHHAGNSTEMIAEQLGVGGIITTISTACSSSLNSIIFGSNLIKSGKANKVIVGGTDALSKFTLNGFNTLMILDREHCRPFDESRTGLNIGESEAYLILEDEQEAINAGRKIYAVVQGYANANDAHHQTASSEDGTGPYLAMKNAIVSAGINADDIDYINAHGTGTDNNDLTESIAIKRLFENKIPDFSSTKAYTGHTLGAAGVIESVITILSLHNSTAFPNINFKNEIEETGLTPVTDVKKLSKANYVLTNSFGFGGNDSSIVFASPKTSVQNENYNINIKAVYINGIGCVSPFEFEPQNEDTQEALPYFQIVKPNYKEYINPKVLRRMSKIVRMGIVSSSQALAEAAIEKPDAIITATGMGCQADTEKFLNSMIDNGEELLTPTSFIQSTHNTVGGSIALGQQNNGYNLTYVHRTFSFESALIDSILKLNANEAQNVLLGGFDEIKHESWLIKTKINFYKSQLIAEGEFLKDTQSGAVAGEGSSFFVLGKEKTDNTYARVLDSKTFFRPEDNNAIASEISSFLDNNNLNEDNIDLVVFGFNGDPNFDSIYSEI